MNYGERVLTKLVKDINSLSVKDYEALYEDANAVINYSVVKAPLEGKIILGVLGLIYIAIMVVVYLK